MRIPTMLLIGSAGRNVGKTELACSIIRRFSPERPMTGIKVTTITARDGTCPRGGKGCGVCSSLTGNYCITEEHGDPPGKDTSRLLEAGAHRVFWLRVMKPYLLEGIQDLLRIVEPGSTCVCESNSLRTVIEPGLFLMVRDRNATGYKASADAVKDLADITLALDGTVFSPDISRVGISDRGWTWQHDATAVILAGGRSTRMEQDKSMLPIDGQPMIRHVFDQLDGNFTELIISSNTPEDYAFLPARVIADQAPGRGPLMGIASALARSGTDLNFITGCDIPDIHMPLVRRLLALADGYDAVVPRTGNDSFEPLFAVYRRNLAEPMQRVLASGKARIRDVFEHCRVKYPDVPKALHPNNLNTREEYETYIAERQR